MSTGGGLVALAAPTGFCSPTCSALQGHRCETAACAGCFFCVALEHVIDIPKGMPGPTSDVSFADCSWLKALQPLGHKEWCYDLTLRGRQGCESRYLRLDEPRHFYRCAWVGASCRHGPTFECPIPPPTWAVSASPDVESEAEMRTMSTCPQLGFTRTKTNVRSLGHWCYSIILAKPREEPSALCRRSYVHPASPGGSGQENGFAECSWSNGRCTTGQIISCDGEVIGPPQRVWAKTTEQARPQARPRSGQMEDWGRFTSHLTQPARQGAGKPTICPELRFTRYKTNLRDTNEWCYSKGKRGKQFCQSLYLFPADQETAQGYSECVWEELGKPGHGNCKAGPVTIGCAPPSPPMRPLPPICDELRFTRVKKNLMERGKWCKSLSLGRQHCQRFYLFPYKDTYGNRGYSECIWSGPDVGGQCIAGPVIPAWACADG